MRMLAPRLVPPACQVSIPLPMGNTGTMGIRSHSITVLAAAAVLLALTACTPESTVDPTPDQAEDSTLPPVSPSPTATDSPDSPGVPINKLCSDLVTDQQLYDFNPNFAADAGYTPATGSDAARLVDLEGLSCGWLNLSSGASVTVSAANLPGPELAEYASASAATGSATDLFGGEGYFRTIDGAGTAEAFVAPYWVIVSSTDFVEAADAAPLVQAALTSLQG